MKKILFTLLFTTIFPTFAIFNYSQFQDFDNQVGFGYNFQQGNLMVLNSTANNSYSINGFNVEAEKLFDIGLWLDLNMGSIQNYAQTINSNSSVKLFGSYPMTTMINSKLGYNFPITSQFALTPYVLLGKNTNLTTFTLTKLSGNSGDITQSFYLTSGLGVRAEVLINQYVELFLDQSFAYNKDMGQLSEVTNQNIIDLSNNQTISTLGIKVNLWQKLQVASNIFYTTYTGYTSNALAQINADGGNANGLPTTGLGIQTSIGFTFK